MLNNCVSYTCILAVLLFILIIVIVFFRRRFLQTPSGTPVDLSLIKSQMRTFVDNLVKKYPANDAVRLLKTRYRNTIVEETSEPETYTLNKGEKMRVCLRNHKSNQAHDDANLIMFVCLHELAHIMSVSNHHTDEFWENFEFLLGEAAFDGIYSPIDYKYDPVWYCAMLVYDNPYFTENPEQRHVRNIRRILAN